MRRLAIWLGQRPRPRHPLPYERLSDEQEAKLKQWGWLLNHGFTQEQRARLMFLRWRYRKGLTS
jgi:hypothetical protein